MVGLKGGRQGILVTLKSAMILSTSLLSNRQFKARSPSRLIVLPGLPCSFVFSFTATSPSCERELLRPAFKFATFRAGPYVDPVEAYARL